MQTKTFHENWCHAHDSDQAELPLRRRVLRFTQSKDWPMNAFSRKMLVFIDCSSHRNDFPLSWKHSHQRPFDQEIRFMLRARDVEPF